MPAPLRRRVVVALLAAASLGCTDALAPADVAGVYVLRRVDGSRLPTELFTNEYGTFHVLADTLRLDAGGRGTRSGASEMVRASDGVRSAPQRGTSAFGFHVVGRHVEIAFDCPANANCIAPPHLIARRVGDELHVVAAPHSLLRLPQHYERVGR